MSAERQAGLAQGLVDHRQDALDVGPRGDLRHHAAEAAVQIVLRSHHGGEHFQPIGHDRRRRLVAGGFQGEDVHGAFASSVFRYFRAACNWRSTKAGSAPLAGSVGLVAAADPWPTAVAGCRASRRSSISASISPSLSLISKPLSGMTPHSSRVLGVGEAVDVLAAGAKVAGGGELQGAVAVLQFDHVLHASLAPGALADDDRPLVVLQAGGHDLAGTGAVAVDQHDHGKALEGAFLVGVPDALGAVAALGADDPAFGNEQVADFDGRTEQPARIEPQVQDQPAQLLRLQLRQARAATAAAVSRLNAVSRT